MHEVLSNNKWPGRSSEGASNTGGAVEQLLRVKRLVVSYCVTHKSVLAIWSWLVFVQTKDMN
jgi:hypothetical protein